MPQLVRETGIPRDTLTAGGARRPAKALGRQSRNPSRTVPSLQAGSRGSHFSAKVTGVFLAALAGEGAWPTKRRAAVARMHLDAAGWVLSVLRFYEIMAKAHREA